MYLDTCKVRSGNKVYTRVLLRESYRQDGKVKHSTITNLSKCSDQEIAAIKFALQHKHDLAAFRENAQLNPHFTLRQGLSIGAVAVLEALARELGLVKALGTDREGKLALWDLTVQEGLKKLSTLCVVEVELADKTSCLMIPEPSADVAKLIELAGVRLPTVFRSRGVKVATRRKLQENRSSR